MRRSNLLLLALSFLAVACQPETGRFTVEGQIAQADGKTMYLDHMGLDKVSVIDSVKLDEDGIFSFTASKSDDCFDFYRLRIDAQTINLVIDSTETVTVKASLPVMQVAYTVDGSEDNIRLKEVVMSQMSFLSELKSVSQQYRGAEVNTRSARINELVDVFKSDLKNEFILKDPASPSSYYALFLSVGGQMLFTPQNDRADAKCYAAVATQMDMLYPDAVRTKHIHNVALKGMSKTKPAAPMSAEDLQKLESLIIESGIIEIELPDRQGISRKLSDEKGKVVLLDFTAYKTDYSGNYNMLLRELYNKYAEKGLSIYQVSFDADESYWANTAGNLPWICVYDESSLNSQILKSYNVSQLPTAFLIDRNGDLVDRPEKTDDLDGKIARLLEK